MKDYDKALAVLREAISTGKDSVDPYYLQAQIYINMGKFREAKDSLSKALARDGMFAPAHYLLGCISIEESLFDSAKESLRRALYIDKDFSLAHFYLAHAYRSQGRTSDAIREYRNALKLLSNTKSDDILAYGGGFDAAAFIGACRDNIERLKMES
jgi:chemotaxis protein methyltransferase CheR